MRWDDFRRSDNIEDDRGAGGGFGGGGGSGIQFGGGGLGIGTVIVLGLIGWALGIDPSVLIGGAEMVSRGGSHYQQPSQPANRRVGAPSDATGQFVAAVLGNTEDVWGEIFRAGGQQYRAPRLRLFTGSEQGGCGFAQAAMGPFYCPTDRRIYLDTSFFREIETRFHGCQGNACKFSQAYVIAHEVGHHVQNLLGTLTKAQRRAARRRQQGGGQPHPGAGRIAGGLLRRRLGESFRAAQKLPRSRRHRCRAADRERHRRRHAAAARAGAHRAGRLHPRLGGTAQALVHHRLQAGHAIGLRHVFGGAALVVIPGRRASAGPGIQMLAKWKFLDSGFARFARAPE